MADQLRTVSGFLDDAHFDGINGGSIKLRSYSGARQVEVIGGATLDLDGVRRMIHALGTALASDRATGELVTVEQVEALPLTAVIQTRYGYVLERLDEGWYRPGVDAPYRNVFPSWLPATLLRDREPEQPESDKH